LTCGNLNTRTASIQRNTVHNNNAAALAGNGGIHVRNSKNADIGFNILGSNGASNGVIFTIGSGFGTGADGGSNAHDNTMNSDVSPPQGCPGNNPDNLTGITCTNNK